MKKTPALHLLEKEGISYELMPYTYDPDDLDVRTIARENDLDVSQIYKTLVLKGNKTGLLVAVIPGHHRLDRKVMAQLSRNKKVSLLPIPDLERNTGYIRGGCCPLAMKSALPVYIDQTAEALGSIWFNAGRRGLLVQVDVSELLRITDGELAGISSEIPFD